MTAPARVTSWSFGRLTDGYQPGPWDGEPDKTLWIDAATDLDCMTFRNRMGVWCGYVGVPPKHPWYGVHYDEIEPSPDVHGGLTFSDFCHEGHGDEAICHTPEPGRPARVWWLGFDCHHMLDMPPLMADPAPGFAEFQSIYTDKRFNVPGFQYVYRTLDYAQAECVGLAAQVDVARRRRYRVWRGRR